MTQLRYASDIYQWNKVWQLLFGISNSNTKKMETFSQSLNLPVCDDAGYNEMKKMEVENNKDFEQIVRYNRLLLNGELWE